MSAGDIELRPFLDPEVAEYVALLNAPELRRHLPLATGLIDEAACRAWMRAKAEQWPHPERLGPWSVYIDGEFAGWGGLQPERDGAAGIALVLNISHWGAGAEIVQLAIATFRRAAPEVPIVADLPLSRRPDAAMRRWGFTAAGEVRIDGVPFHRYLLSGF